jgi:tetratricopeptide (TPR) repeat protein
MDVLGEWRASFPAGFRLFAGFAAEDRSISVEYGVVAGALLWGLPSADALSAISLAVDVPLLEAAVDLLRRGTPLAGARELSLAAREDPALRRALSGVLDYFREDCLRHGLLKPAVQVEGRVEGANIVIGGAQYVAGDLVISQTVVRPHAAARPVAPNPPQHFTGRRLELDRLAEALRAGQNMAITGVQGMGGIGKTALALQFAAEQRDFSAVLWASLGPAPSPAYHLVSWARHADPDVDAGDSPLDVLAGRVRALLTDLVRDRFPGRVLVLIDDIWEGDSVAAARLLQLAAPAHSVCLITTRSQLVVAQLRSTRLELTPMTPPDAIALLRRLLADHPTIHDEQLADLAQVVGHHPLAMELAAGQAQLLERPVVELPQLIAEYRGGIPAGSPFRDIRLELGEARQDNLELVLSFSYAALDAADQACFRSLGVLAYGAEFDRPLCQSLWEQPPASVLDRLRHRAVLSIGTEPGWYQQHQLLRAYARALLTQNSAEHGQISDRYAVFVTAVTEQFGTLPLTDWHELDPYLPHVEEVGTILTGHPPGDIELDFALHTRPLLAARRELNHPDWLAMGLAVSKARLDRSLEILFLNDLGEDQYFRGDPREAIKSLYAAQQIANAAKDREALARTLSNLGRFQQYFDTPAASKALWQAISLYEELADFPGLIVALLRMAECQVSPRRSYAERANAIQFLERACTEAQNAGFEQGEAEAKLQRGRLLDTLGDRDGAITLLTEATDQLARLKLRDREAVAHLSLAAALANTERFTEAETHLNAALPLVTTTGYAVAHATALRNLGELRAYQGRPADALACFAEALPLVRRQTMRWVDEDFVEISVAQSFFTARLEAVAHLEHAEQFRHWSMTEHSDGKPAPGRMPDEVLAYLLSQTLLGEPSWMHALRGFSTALTDPQERAFVDALIDITLGGSPVLPDDNPYSPYVPVLHNRMGLGKHPILLPDEEAERFVSNTIAVKLAHPEHWREWTIELRKAVRAAHEWGDHNEEQLVRALLAVLADRLIWLPATSPYRPHLDRLFEALAQYETLPLQFVMENTVAALTVVPHRRASWTEFLHDARLDAVRHGERAEQEFIDALVLLLDGERTTLRPGSPYADSYDTVVAAVAAGQPIFQRPPIATLQALGNRILAARTTEPKLIDQLFIDVRLAKARAEAFGRSADAALYQSATELLLDKPFSTPPDPFLQVVIDHIGTQRPRPCRDDTLPAEQVGRLAAQVVGALTDEPDQRDQVRDQLAGYEHVLVTRNADWANEAAFVSALSAIVAGNPIALPESNPYQSVVDQILQNIQAYPQIRTQGGQLTPSMLNELLFRTAAVAKGQKDHIYAMMDAGKFVEMMTSYATSDLAAAHADWQESLRQIRHQENWQQHETDLLDALLAVLEDQPPALPRDNPYSAAFQEMLATMGFTSGMPDNSVAALALAKDEFYGHVKDAMSGRAIFVASLDRILDSTVLAQTVILDQRDEWRQRLAKLKTDMTTSSLGASAVQDELDLIDGLAAVLRSEPAELSASHPYYDHLDHVINSISMFHGQLTWPGCLTTDQVMHFCVLTSGALTIEQGIFEPLRDDLTAFRHAHARDYADDHETLAFLDALLITLDGRTADLPLGNRYRPFLRLTQNQTRALQTEEQSPQR